MPEIFVLKGLLVGLIFGVPAGAIGALTIQRSLHYGFKAGFITGLGSSFADVLYACIGVFGLSLIQTVLVKFQFPITIVGACLIVLIGIQIFCKKENLSQTKLQTKSHKYLAFFASAFAIAITNPATIFSFILAFATFGIANNLQAIQGLMLILGILLGTVIWWLTLSGISSIFRNRITNKVYTLLNKILGTALIIFAIIMVIRGISLL